MLRTAHNVIVRSEATSSLCASNAISHQQNNVVDSNATQGIRQFDGRTANTFENLKGQRPVPHIPM